MSKSPILAGTVVVAAGVLSSELGSEQVVLNLRDGVYYGLEDAGRDIWSLIQTPTTVDELCLAIIESYDVDPDRCRQDVGRLLRDLVDRGLVELRT
jgi:hypothetical protein